MPGLLADKQIQRRDLDLKAQGGLKVGGGTQVVEPPEVRQRHRGRFQAQIRLQPILPMFWLKGKFSWHGAVENNWGHPPDLSGSGGFAISSAFKSHHP
jgi:hypothetical protein